MDEDRIALWRRNGQLIRENARMRRVVEAALAWDDAGTALATADPRPVSLYQQYTDATITLRDALSAYRKKEAR